jgi:hypothetical protein
MKWSDGLTTDLQTQTVRTDRSVAYSLDILIKGDEMKKWISMLSAAAVVITSVLIGQPALLVQADKHATILEFSTMVGVSAPYTGNTNPIRGINGGGLPWVIASGHGELNTAGAIEVEVKGLVLANDPSVPANLRGTNPVPQFKAIVSCQSIGAGGTAITVTVATRAFNATSSGNASIEDTITLPRPCITPIIFVTSPGGAWFAATGF